MLITLTHNTDLKIIFLFFIKLKFTFAYGNQYLKSK